MPPKPRVPRKASLASKDVPAALLTGIKSEKDGRSDMPPPPDPLPPTKILEAEVSALSGCLKNAIVKTGQIYGFYADTRRLGIHEQAPHPPRSLTASLGREVEKYDQLCDAIESQLLRAISVLQRDLVREEKRIKEIQTGAVASRTRSKSASLSPSSTRVPLPPVAGALIEGADTDVASPSQMTPVELPARNTPATSVPLGRRASTISLSSLHRPPFPLKLDLSATGLRMTPEEASLFSNGLASPVTLAPKSARPTNDLSPELMAAFAASSSNDATNRPIDIDLTVPDTSNPNASVTGDDIEMNLDPAVGNSADKPIELDLEGMEMDIDMSTMTDLFGDSADTSSTDGNAAVEGLFSPSTSGPMSSAVADGKVIKEEGDIGLGILEALSGSGENDDLFASFGGKSEQNEQINENKQSLEVPPTTRSSVTAATRSPSSLLDSFASVSNINADHSSHTDGDAPFDLLDLSHLSPGFFTNPQGTEMNLMEMADFLNMGGDGEVDSANHILPEGGKSTS